MPDNFSHQTNTGKTVNIVGDHTVVQVFDDPKTRTENIQPDIRRFFVSLKERYQNRYEQKLDGRFEITLEVSENFDSQNPQRFIERYAKDAKVSEAFTAINNAFQKTGRLLVVGSPGAGKTVLLLKLALNLLNKTDLARQEPFPVIFNLASWSSGKYDSFGDWASATLVSSYGLSRYFAETLLEQERIIFLLDGLDELARNRTESAHWERAGCLASLNDYLRRGRKAVICCRREEFVQMRNRTGQDAPVAAKIEILDLTKEDIVLALLYAQEDKGSRAAANNLLKIIETNEIFLEVLSTPFYFTTALEVFDKELWAEKDFPQLPGEQLRLWANTGFSSDAGEIKKYLLSRFVETKLNHSPNPNRFPVEKTKKWLQWLAKKFDKDGLTLFELVEIDALDIDGSKLTMYFWGIAFFNIILFSRLLESFEESYAILAISIYVIMWFTFSTLREHYRVETEDAISLDLGRLLDRDFWKELFSTTIERSLFGLSVGLPLGLFSFGFFSISNFSFAWGYAGTTALSFIPTTMIVGAISGVFITGFESLKKIKKFDSLEYPYQRLLGGFSSNLFLSVFVILLFLIGMRMYESHLKETTPYLYPYYETYMVLILYPLFFTFLTLYSSPLFRHVMLRVDLYRENKMPLKYATFLDYAVSLRIIEKDGGHWRFRHQNLQEHFATLDDGIEPNERITPRTALMKKTRLKLARLFRRAPGSQNECSS